jgi:cell division septation protein DedD
MRISILVVCALLICSCRTQRVTSTSPYLEEDNSKTEVTVRTEKIKPVDTSDKTLYKYYVIIGSFKSVANAREYNVGLTKEGFTPAILENENGLFRISVGGYDDEKAARAKIAGIRATYEAHRDVWLLVRK